jgi:predicted anti-sigma-YlaC factor YlaD
MLKCVEATRMVSESQERELRLLERLSLRVHLMMCTGCRNFERQMPVLRRALRSFAKSDQEANFTEPNERR